MTVPVSRTGYPHDYLMISRIAFTGVPSATAVALFTADRDMYIDAIQVVIGRSTTTPGGNGLSLVNFYKIKNASTALTDTSFPVTADGSTANPGASAVAQPTLVSLATAAGSGTLASGWFKPTDMPLLYGAESAGIARNFLAKGETLAIQIDGTGTFTGYVGPFVNIRIRSKKN